MGDYMMVFVTVDKMENARRIAHDLVTRKLAACVNVIDKVTSVYTWQGRVQDDEEVLMIIKTKASLFEDLRSEIINLHPYDVPEVVGMEISKGHEPYLSWIDETTAGK